MSWQFLVSSILLPRNRLIYQLLSLQHFSLYLIIKMDLIIKSTLIITTCAFLGLASNSGQQTLFLSTQVQMTSPSGNSDQEQRTFTLAQKFPEKGRFLLNVQDLTINCLEGYAGFIKFGWEVKLQDHSKVTLSTFKTPQQSFKIIYKLKLHMVFINDVLSPAFYFKEIEISQSSKHALEGLQMPSIEMGLQVNKKQRYFVFMMLRGFQATSDFSSNPSSFLHIKSMQIQNRSLIIEVERKGITKSWVTVIIIDRTQLSKHSIEVSFEINQFNHDETQFQLQLFEKVELIKCQLTLSSIEETCWQLNPIKQALQFKTTPIINKEKLQNECDGLNTVVRRLDGDNGCDPDSCSCTGFQYATSCYEDSTCVCKIKTCSTGYYTTASLVSNCTPCPANLTNCISCGLKYGTTTVICNSCQTGYTVLNNVCSACPLGCITCVTISVNGVLKASCESCVSTMDLQSSGGSVKTCVCTNNKVMNSTTSPVSCVSCPSICSSCSSITSCTSCSNGYYLQSSSCLSCMPICKTCSVYTSCSSCYTTSFTIIGGLCTCSPPLFVDIATKSCRKCSALKSNCITCAYAFAYDPTNPPAVVCTVASAGYYVSAGSAVPCISHCTDCSLAPAILCNSCAANFTFDGSTCVCSGTGYYQSTKNACLNCGEVITGCVSCQSNIMPASATCLSCDPAGYFPSTSYPTSSCTACSSLCQTCTALNACTLCINNLIVIFGACVCDSALSLFFYSPTQSCLACGSTIFNCQICDSTTNPISCSTCTNGSYLSSDHLSCLSCPASCSLCANSTICSACELGYELVNNSCICGSNCTTCMSSSVDGLCSSCILPVFSCLSCLTGYVLSGLSCVSCNITWPACIECTLAACLSCSAPFILTVTGCQCNYTAQMYLSSNASTCEACSTVIPQCIACTSTNPTTCSFCAKGYFSTSPLACSPCTGNCLICTSSSINCLSCLPTYTMVFPNICNCNFTDGYYFDSLTGGCSFCSSLIPQCLSCSLYLTNQAQCTLCSDGFYWNALSFTCNQCSSPCSKCSSSTVCTNCINNLVLSDSLGWAITGLCVCDDITTFLHALTSTCESCSFLYPSCTLCSGNGSLVICSSCLSSTYLQNNSCINCPTSCATCNQTHCLTCPGNMTLSAGICICEGLCIQCSALSTSCLSCTIASGVITSCFLCESGTYLSSPICVSCPSNCATCTSSSNCLTCNPTYVLINSICTCPTTLNIFPNINSLCTLCSLIYDSCTECSSSSGGTICITCVQGYFISGIQCSPCNSSCLTCSGSSTTCTSCQVGLTLAGGVCSCNSTSCLACNAAFPNCIQCIYTVTGSTSMCSVCSPGFYLSSASCFSCPTVCNTCGTNGICLTCFDTFSVVNGTCICNFALELWKSNGTCQQCSLLISKCLKCTQNGTNPLNVSCVQCQPHYYLVNSTSCVLSICGDGHITTGEICDDGNTNSGDGCSAFCEVEQGFICTGQPSICTINLNFKITLNTIQTSKTVCNRVSISFKLTPIYESYRTADFGSMLGYVSLSSLLCIGWSYQGGIVTYNFDYTSTINNAYANFSFIPASLSVNETNKIPIIVVSTQLVSTNNIALIYYNNTICENKKNFQSLTSALYYASYATLALSILPCKIIGLQLFGVIQMAHLNVGNMDNVNTLMTPLMGLKGAHGFSMDIGRQSSSSRLLQTSTYTPNRVQSIGYESNFLRNCNVMLIIVVSVILIAAILYCLAYFCKSCAPRLHSISQSIIKEVLLTLILFNCFNFAYSAGLHFNYAPASDSLYIAGTAAAISALILPVFMAFGLMCANDEGFGQYKQKFKEGTFEKMYFVITILYRSGIGIYISTMNENDQSTLIVMGLAICFLLYNLINLPYAKAFHNYRANVCHVTQFICLFVTLYYRSMMSTASKTSVSTIFSPVYLEYFCISLSLIVSVIVLFYQIYLIITDCIKKQRKKKTRQLQRTNSQNEKNHPHLGTEDQLDKAGQLTLTIQSLDE